MKTDSKIVVKYWKSQELYIIKTYRNKELVGLNYHSSMIEVGLQSIMPNKRLLDAYEVIKDNSCFRMKEDEVIKEAIRSYRIDIAGSSAGLRELLKRMHN